MTFISIPLNNMYSKKNIYSSKIITCSASQNTENDYSIPGKMKFSDIEIIKREKDLKALANKWKKRTNFKRRRRKKVYWLHQKL